MIVSAPASSANLGPGFDCLGLALDLPFRFCDDDEVPEGFHLAEPTHPAAAAYVVAGGSAERTLSWLSPIPPGRGLGFSGAARVAGAFLAHRRSGFDEAGAQRGAMRVASMLEGHPDNAAPSTYGGFTVAVGERVISLALPDGIDVVVWSPEKSTSTDASRRTLPASVSLTDAAFSASRAALWVAAVASGDLAALRTACEDRLHQPARLAARPDSAAALDTLLGDEDVVAAWLSGSGPTVAALAYSAADLGGTESVLSATGRIRRVSPCAVGVADSGL